ncbi:NnrS family protein [Neptuniibacter sp. CAU 1671]|uniref:NnrS family protein n=1 Tax=Neptuniibacter sp. CAU 1671 TaxID=3032593 RepID=UPI0023DA55E3|nr:NnrS family protein [Neptuniibacter sp. CAU 1671]MDF2182164.1 NnrS family protein [Neptuniibacter sp. CAU 1671]
MIQLQERQTPGRFALFYLGFRPFFLAGAAVAMVLIPLWLAVYQGKLQPYYYPEGITWHGHEMIFGFALAIIAGFLLTAVRNWTSINTLQGIPLALLTLLWLMARVFPWIGGLPAIWIAAADLSFLPLLIVCLARPILLARNYRNLVFLVILCLFWIANLLVHLDLLGITAETRHTGILMALFLVVIIMTLLGGRVIPFFTERGIAGVQCTRRPWLEKILLPLSLLWLPVSLSEFRNVTIALALTLALLNTLRWIGWFDRRVLAHPLIWILQVGYAFIGLGYGLYGFALLDMANISSAIHAFAVGGIGCLTLGMMARVSLGHTGRALTVSPMMITAFSLMAIAALLRICLPLAPVFYAEGLALVVLLWTLGWMLFLIRYIPILIQPRVDGVFG